MSIGENSRHYHLKQSESFYDEIADIYPNRLNSLHSAVHLSLVSNLNASLKAMGSLNVLDLGGGTGSELAEHFVDEKDVSWTYIDISTRMTEKFRQKILKARPDWSANCEDLFNFISTTDRVFDVIILSFVVNSLQEEINFNNLKHILRVGGIIVIAEFDYKFSTQHPNFCVTKGTNKLSLEIKAVSQKKLADSAIESGFRLERIFEFKTPKLAPFSYILQLENPKTSQNF